MIVSDDVLRVVAIVVWVAVVLRGVRARTLTHLWSACLLVAVSATLTVGSNAAVLDAVTGIGGGATLAAHLAALGAAVLVVRGQSGPAGEHPRVPPPLLVGAAGAALLGMVGTWLAEPHGSPGPAATAHELIVHAMLLAAVLATAPAVRRELAALPTGGVRIGLRMLLGAAGCLFLASVLGIVTRTGALVGIAPGGPVPVVTGLAQGAFVLLFAVGVSVPLLRRDPAPASRAEITELWQWLVEPFPDQVLPATDADDVFPMLVEIRDRMWMLQHRIDRGQVAAVTRQARRRGLAGTSRRAFTAAVCLELGVAAEQAGTDRHGEPVDLSRLGGGRTPELEAAWLAAVARSRRGHDARTVATRIRSSRSATAGAAT